MASIYRRKNKNGTTAWRAVIRIKGHPSVCNHFERKQEAQDWATEIERQIKTGRFKFNQHNKIYTFDELVNRFINDGILEHHKSSKDTIRHLNYWKEHLKDYSLIYITTEMIGKERQTLINTPIKKGTQKQKRSPATVNRYMSSLSTILTYAKKLKWIDENPCFNITKLKESPGRDRALTTKEAANLLLACQKSSSSYLYCIVLIAITTGARKSEILSLKWDDIDFENKIAYLKDTKNTHPRTIPLVDEIITELQKMHTLRNPHKPLVFASKTAFGKIDITKPWKKALKASGITNFVFHSLRHSFATFAAKQGASSLELQTATGHRSLEMLQRYTHLEASLTRKFSKNISQTILSGGNS